LSDARIAWSVIGGPFLVFLLILTQHLAEPPAAGGQNCRKARTARPDGSRRARSDRKVGFLIARSAARNDSELSSLWHHQQHGPAAPDRLERHETPNPLRSDAVESRIQCVREASGSGPNAVKPQIQCVRQVSGSGPIFMINLSGKALERRERGIHAVWTAGRG
jgi:hypothetical protein